MYLLKIQLVSKRYPHLGWSKQVLKGRVFFFKQSQTKATQKQGWKEEQQGRLFPARTPRCFERHSKADSGGEPAPWREENRRQMCLQAMREMEASNFGAAADSCGCSCARGQSLSPPTPALAVAQASVPKTRFRQNPSSSASEGKRLIYSSSADLPGAEGGRSC